MTATLTASPHMVVLFFLVAILYVMTLPDPDRVGETEEDREWRKGGEDRRK